MNFINTHISGLKKGKHVAIKITTGSTFRRWLSLISTTLKMISRNLSGESSMPCPTPLSMKSTTRASETTFRNAFTYSSATRSSRAARASTYLRREPRHIRSQSKPHQTSTCMRTGIGSGKESDCPLIGNAYINHNA